MEPGRIVMGGGVMKSRGLIERVRDEAVRLGAGYFRGNPQDIVVSPGLGEQAGLLGGLALALDAVSA
jgi:fructokinase